MYKFLSTLIFIGITLTVCGQELPVRIDYLRFVENKGQWNENIRFKAEIPNGQLIVQDDFLGYVLYNAEEYNHALSVRHDHFLDSVIIDTPEFSVQAFKVNFLNALILDKSNSNSSKLPQPKLSANKSDLIPRNYFKGKDETKWATNVLGFEEIYYKNLYSGIDFRLFAHDGSLKYEFVVSPKSNPNNILMEYEGVDSLELKDDQLLISTAVATIKEDKPFAYQVIRGVKKQVKCEFGLVNNVVSFKLGRYNKNIELVIDPQLIFSTYSGSTADNWGNTACLDKNGNLYTGGTVFGTTKGTYGIEDLTGFPATKGAFQTKFEGGDTDIGILKFDSSGNYLEYATYIGGDDAEIPTSMITNDAGELFILGTTGSLDFPNTVGKYQEDFAGGDYAIPVGGYAFQNGTDIIIIKVNPQGSKIEATYLGGSSNDGLNYRTALNYGDQLRGDINVDSLNNIYIVSTTFSSDLPVKNALQENLSGETDAIIAKFTPDLTDVYWATYLGGSEQESGIAINRDSLNNVYVVGGSTSHTDFPETHKLNGFLGGDFLDGFVTKIDSSGDSLLSSIKIGVGGVEQVYFVQTDDFDNVYLLGQNLFSPYPVTPGIYNNPNAGVFIHKMNSRLDSTFFSTTVGDTIEDVVFPNFSPTAFLVNECENIFIAGWGGEENNFIAGYKTWTYNMPVTENAFQKTTDSSDFYMMVLKKDVEELIYATYFGSPKIKEHVDGGTSRFDKQGIVYQSVCGGCVNQETGENSSNLPNELDFPLVPEENINNPALYPHKNRSGNCNNAVIKFDLAYLKAAYTSELICDSMLVKFENLTVGGVDFYWDFGDGKDTITYEAVDIQHRYETEGVYTVKLIATDLTTCIGKDSSIQQIVVEQPLESKSYKDTICQGDSLKLVIDDIEPTYKYSWKPTESLEYPEDASPVAFPDTTTIYTVDIETIRGCAKTDTFELAITQMLDSIKYDLIGSCHALPTIQFHSLYSQVPGIKYEWDFGDGNTSNQPSPRHQYSEKGAYMVKLRVENKYCFFEDEASVFVEPIYIPNIFTPNGDGKNETFEVTGIDGTGNWKVEIYNRWGKDVFTDEVYQNQWDGHDLSDGTYYYLVTAPDKTTCKGWVHVVR